MKNNMNWYLKFIEAEKVQPKESNYSWVRLDAPKEIIDIHQDYAHNEIDEEDLYIEEMKNRKDWSYGIEDSPHITVKWGIDFDDPSKIIKCLDGEDGGNVTLDDIEIFETNKDYDVLVVICNSDALQTLHQKLTDDLEIEDDYPTYKPHITIAYFKKGKAKKYLDSAKKAFTYYLLDFDFDKVIFENTDDQETVIRLG